MKTASSFVTYTQRGRLKLPLNVRGYAGVPFGRANPKSCRSEAAATHATDYTDPKASPVVSVTIE